MATRNREGRKLNVGFVNFRPNLLWTTSSATRFVCGVSCFFRVDIPEKYDILFRNDVCGFIDGIFIFIRISSIRIRDNANRFSVAKHQSKCYGLTIGTNSNPTSFRTIPNARVTSSAADRHYFIIVVIGAIMSCVSVAFSVFNALTLTLCVPSLRNRFQVNVPVCVCARDTHTLRCATFELLLFLFPNAYLAFVRESVRNSWASERRCMGEFGDAEVRRTGRGFHGFYLSTGEKKVVWVVFLRSGCGWLYVFRTKNGIERIGRCSTGFFVKYFTMRILKIEIDFRCWKKFFFLIKINNPLNFMVRTNVLVKNSISKMCNIIYLELLRKINSDEIREISVKILAIKKITLNLGPLNNLWSRNSFELSLLFITLVMHSF